MPNTFFISDQHYGHGNILTFLGLDGKKIRPQFNNVQEMNETLTRNYNSVVGVKDTVYFLGDVTFTNRLLHEIMPQLKGEKRLILGNHDCLRPDEYLKYFKKIYSARKWNTDPRIMLCHYPLHIDANHPKPYICVHGHIHEKVIYGRFPTRENPDLVLEDPRYFNVSVERINYTPIELEEMMKIIRTRLKNHPV